MLDSGDGAVGAGAEGRSQSGIKASGDGLKVEVGDYGRYLL
jgi:hypothetical protein